MYLKGLKMLKMNHDFKPKFINVASKLTDIPLCLFFRFKYISTFVGFENAFVSVNLRPGYYNFKRDCVIGTPPL
jgi:hypothetical protein